jgi:hypothetical protein
MPRPRPTALPCRTEHVKVALRESIMAHRAMAQFNHRRRVLPRKLQQLPNNYPNSGEAGLSIRLFRDPSQGTLCFHCPLRGSLRCATREGSRCHLTGLENDRCGHCRYGYLMAGGSRPRWQSPRPGHDWCMEVTDEFRDRCSFFKSPRRGRSRLPSSLRWDDASIGSQCGGRLMPTVMREGLAPTVKVLQIAERRYFRSGRHSTRFGGSPRHCLARSAARVRS